jgi:enoyl-CoA hydratase/carnithine racemase
MEQTERTSSSDTRDNSDLLGGKALDELVLYDVPENHIARITLNRPERRNAIVAPDMQDYIAELVHRAEDDDDIKVILFDAAGEHFCAGEDMRRLPVEGMGLQKGNKRLGQSKRVRGATKLHATLDRLLIFSDKTTVLTARGAVIGAGLHLALGADFLIASETAYFGRPQARLGFAAFNTALPVFVQKLGVNRAYEVLMTGRTIPAEELHSWGVVNSVVSDDKLEDEGLRYARMVAMHSADGLMIGRKAMQMWWNMAGMGQWSSFMTIGHPLFTNLVWREDETNFLRERDKVGHLEAMKNLKDRWAELGFE